MFDLPTIVKRNEEAAARELSRRCLRCRVPGGYPIHLSHRIRCACADCVRRREEKSTGLRK